MCFCLSNSAGLFQIWTPRLKRDEVVTVRPISNANETSPFSSGLQRQKRTPEGDDPARQRRPQVTFYHFIFARPFLSCRERHSSLELSGSDCRPGQRTGQTVRDLLRRWFNQIFNSLLLLLLNCIIPLDHSEALTGWWRSTQTYITRGQLFILLLGAKSKTTPAAAAVTLWLVKIDCSWFKCGTGGGEPPVKFCTSVDRSMGKCGLSLGTLESTQIWCAYLMSINRST